VHTTTYYTEFVKSRHHALVNTNKKDAFHVVVKKDTKLIFNDFANKYKRSIGFDSQMLLDSLILYRSQTLPAVAVSKPLQYSSKHSGRIGKYPTVDLDYFRKSPPKPYTN
jgi:hypothetical protein